MDTLWQRHLIFKHLMFLPVSLRRSPTSWTTAGDWSDTSSPNASLLPRALSTKAERQHHLLQYFKRVPPGHVPAVYTPPTVGGEATFTFPATPSPVLWIMDLLTIHLAEIPTSPQNFAMRNKGSPQIESLEKFGLLSQPGRPPPLPVSWDTQN